MGQRPHRAIQVCPLPTDYRQYCYRRVSVLPFMFCAKCKIFYFILDKSIKKERRVPVWGSRRNFLIFYHSSYPISQSNDTSKYSAIRDAVAMSGKRSPLSYRLMLFLLVCTKSATTRRLTRFFSRNLCIRCPNPSGPFGTERSCSSFTLHHQAFFFWQGRMGTIHLLEGQNLMRCRYATPLFFL